MAVPPAASAFYREQRRVARRAMVPAARVWGDVAPDDFDAWFATHADELTGLLVIAQTETISQSLDYVGTVLSQQRAAVTPEVDPDPTGLVGVAGDGRPLRSLLYGAVISTRRAITKTPEPDNQAFQSIAWQESGLPALLVRMQTVIADTSRAATSLGTIARPGVGYTRMLVGSSCSRCVVLAGRTYGSATPFLRHPGCDCRHIPTREAQLPDRTVDPDEYFRSLTPAEQDAKFTKAGAQAIRDGADVAQVVNARRGAGLDYAAGHLTAAEAAAIRTGRGVLRARAVTTEGTTRRGLAYRALRAGDGTTPPQRLMPEAIYQAAGEDRDEALRLLRLHGYANDAGTRAPATAGGGGGGVPPRRPGQQLSAGDDDGFDRIDAMFAQWTTGVSATERASVRRWQSMDRFYVQVQAAAQGRAADPQAYTVAGDLMAIARRGQLAAPVAVWRGVRSSQAVFGVPADELESVVGRDEVLNRFFATSTDPRRALEEFTRPPNASGAVLMRVRAAAGTPAAWIAAVGDPALREQAELLFTPGSRLRIVAIDRSGEVPIVDVEVRSR